MTPADDTLPPEGVPSTLPCPPPSFDVENLQVLDAPPPSGFDVERFVRLEEDETVQ